MVRLQEGKGGREKVAHIFQASIVTSFLSIELGSRVQLSAKSRKESKAKVPDQYMCALSRTREERKKEERA